MKKLQLSRKNPCVCWFSGGVTSAVACKLAIDLFGKENCVCLFIDTGNEDEDSYRFKDDCERWFGMSISTIRNDKYSEIQEVWKKFKGLNFANGAICSSELKREVRVKWQRENKFGCQVFGFDIDEGRRAKSFTMNYGETNPIYPLMFFGYTKKMCLEMIVKENIIPPRAYEWGFNNNNCLKTGCVQGGVGYWQKMKDMFPDRFKAMAEMEHELTRMKGKPVTMLREPKKKGNDKQDKVFLIHNPNYPEFKDISMLKGRPPKPLLDCNGFCGVNDLERSETEDELSNDD